MNKDDLTRLNQAESNYLSELNGYILDDQFWIRNEEYDFTGTETKLFMYLIRVCRKLNWKNPFYQSYRQIATKSGLHIRLLKNAMTRLSQAGLIEVIPGKRGNRYDITNKTQFRILPVDKIATGNATGNATGSETIININNNKRESNKNSFTPPPIFEIIQEFEKVFREQKINVNPKIEAEKFTNHYTGVNWFAGRRKITEENWRNIVNSWSLKIASMENINNRNNPEPTKKTLKIITE